MRNVTVRTLIVLALVSTTGFAVVAPARAASAADTAAPELVDVSLSRARVAVSGVRLVPVTLRVHLTDESGVQHVLSPEGFVNSPLARIERISGGEPRVVGAELALTSGTSTDGVWSAVIQVPSTWRGVWAVTYVTAWDVAFNNVEVDPRAVGMERRLRVRGSHLPAMTMRFVPEPVPAGVPVTMKGRFYYRDTGAPIRNQPIFISFDNMCIEHAPVPNGRTDRNGRYSVTISPERAVGLQCVGILRPSNMSFYPDFIVVKAGAPRME
ncbi:MAG TPA: hypothetical protein VFT95_08975 [Micromonosporaceae bacterium]|nr:hypothetical protein [Micromonosporaceae bacterium]